MERLTQNQYNSIIKYVYLTFRGGVHMVNINEFKNAIQLEKIEDILKQCFEAMLNQKVESVKELELWLLDLNEVLDIVNERLYRDYSEFQCHNDDEIIKQKFEYDQEVVSPIVKNYTAKFDKFFYDNVFRKELPSKYDILVKKKVNAIELFRQENIQLEVEEDKLVTKYYTITGSMSIMWNGEEKTIPQMAVYLKDPDRSIREKAWKLVQNRRLQDIKKLDEIMDELVKIRNKKAINANMKNYRDYMFKALQRFDYTPEDCLDFHEAVLKYVVPISAKIEKQHMKNLNLNSYRPWDMDAVPEGEKPLKPYGNIDELVNGVINIFGKTDNLFMKTLNDMKDGGTLDLESRKAKSPGGYCIYYPVSKIPFIFMNSAKSHDDLVTLTHEGGHSVHSMLCSNIKIAEYREVPSESAELASMSMELICMDKWDEFYKNEEDLKKAKREHLEGIIKFLPWGITVDRFQHWIYLNPESTSEERNSKFAEIAKQFTYSFVDWTGYEENLANRWKAQLHIFEVPFYYIEYAIAQLGALQIWRQYKINPKTAIENYKKALSLGASASLGEVYKTAGISFDFSEKMIKELMEFTWNELEKLY